MGGGLGYKIYYSLSPRVPFPGLGNMVSGMTLLIWIRYECWIRGLTPLILGFTICEMDHHNTRLLGCLQILNESFILMDQNSVCHFVHTHELYIPVREPNTH